MRKLFDTDEIVIYNLIELKIDENLKAMWRSYHRRLTKGLIKFDAIISRSVDVIIKMLTHNQWRCQNVI